jgi:hypothetical protein
VRLRAGDDALDALVNTYRAEERKPLPAFFSDLPSASTEWKEWLRSNKPPRPLL